MCYCTLCALYVLSGPCALQVHPGRSTICATSPLCALCVCVCVCVRARAHYMCIPGAQQVRCWGRGVRAVALYGRSGATGAVGTGPRTIGAPIRGTTGVVASVPRHSCVVPQCRGEVQCAIDWASHYMCAGSRHHRCRSRRGKAVGTICARAFGLRAPSSIGVPGLLHYMCGALRCEGFGAPGVPQHLSYKQVCGTRRLAPRCRHGQEGCMSRWKPSQDSVHLRRQCSTQPWWAVCSPGRW